MFWRANWQWCLFTSGDRTLAYSVISKTNVWLTAVCSFVNYVYNFLWVYNDIIPKMDWVLISQILNNLNALQWSITTDKNMNNLHYLDIKFEIDSTCSQLVQIVCGNDIDLPMRIECILIWIWNNHGSSPHTLRHIILICIWIY